MSVRTFSPETTVLETLNTAHGTSRVFTSHRTACVGCYLARFCTLKEVAATYSLPLDAFLAELEQAAPANPQYLTGDIHEQMD